jgi:D-alanyl-D-alanine carboxypeptidase
VLLESTTGRAYHEVQREWILEPLGMRHTHMAYVDDPSPRARAEEMDVWFGTVPMLSSGYDLSFDWGGGGQVSTVADMCRFLGAVLDGTLHGNTAERLDARWLKPAGLTPPRDAVGLGLFRWIAGRRVVVGHAGAWGVRVFRDPATGASLAGTVNQRDEGKWVADIFDLVEEALR